MIKKLALTTIFLFVALGALVPHSLSAGTNGADVNKYQNAAGLSIFSIVTSQQGAALHPGECTSGYPSYTTGSVSSLLFNVGGAIGGSRPYTDILQDGCALGTASSADWTQEETTAYFNLKGKDLGGLNGILTTVNAGILDQRPASGVDFVSDKVYAISNFGKVSAATNPEPSTYYPGPGSELLRPIQGFWGWSVNLVFGFLVLLIIVIALAIMFRQRLGGAAEVTIQNAIPSIALAMILIPLSYAISGLFIDGITLGTNVIHGFLLGPQSPGAAVYSNRDNKDAVNCDLQNTDVGSATNCDRGLYADDPTIDVWRLKDRIDLRQTGAQIGEGVSNALGGINAQGIFNLIGSILKLLPGDEGTFSEYAWFGNVINIIIGILTIWIALQIFFKLIGKYMTLIIFPAFSPFVFATAALPGNGTKSIVTYLKILGSAALFYIVTYAMFILTLIFTDPTFQNSLPDFRTNGYIPPLLGIQAILKDLTSTANAFPLTQLLMTLVGLGIYFSIPSVLDSIDDALGTKFVLPQFVKTPFESMQESFKVATRAFPAAAARVTRTTASGVRGVAATGVNAGFNVQRAIERAQGISASDPRSIAQRRKNANIAKRQQLLAELDKAGTNIPARAAIQAQLSQLDMAESLQGKEFSTRGEADKEREIKATLTWKGTEKMFIIKQSEAASWRTLSAGGEYATADVGELAIEAVNFTFPNRINPAELIVGTVDEARNIGLPLLGTKEIFNTAIPGISLRQIPFVNNAYPTSAAYGGVNAAGLPLSNQAGIFATFKGGNSAGGTSPNDIVLAITGDNSFNTDNGKKIKFKLRMFVKSTAAVFGTPTAPGLLAPGVDVVTSKRAFKYGPYESNPVSAVIQLVKD